MKRIMLQVMMNIALSIALIGCGGGGGDGSSTPTKKVSLVDGTWKSGDGSTQSTVGIYSAALGVYDSVTFSDGKINTSGYFYYSISKNITSYSNKGTFTVTGNTLTYNLVSESVSTSAFGSTVSDLMNNSGSYSPLNETHTVSVSVIGGTMLWKNSSGDTVATFTK